jgi:hypothetical protein
MSCFENKEDNPFGPVCQCCECLKCSRRSRYCFNSSDVAYRGKWHPKPKFKLFFKAGIPCVECKRLNCPCYLLSSTPCEQNKCCEPNEDLQIHKEEWWVENFAKRPQKCVNEKHQKRPQIKRINIDIVEQHRNLFFLKLHE